MLEGPPTVGMIVVTAQRGGTFREAIAITNADVEAPVDATGGQVGAR